MCLGKPLFLIYSLLVSFLLPYDNYKCEKQANYSLIYILLYYYKNKHAAMFESLTTVNANKLYKTSVIVIFAARSTAFLLGRPLL